ncbi:MAG: hypothetical protein KGY81_08550 [Phycisphaerae bacterium]|nr:hypothetical protein [Phycisphaerae bacterium]
MPALTCHRTRRQVGQADRKSRLTSRDREGAVVRAFRVWSRPCGRRAAHHRDEQRQQFFMKWRTDAIDDPQHFSVTINLAQVDEPVAERLIANLVRALRAEPALSGA